MVRDRAGPPRCCVLLGSLNHESPASTSSILPPSQELPIAGDASAAELSRMMLAVYWEGNISGCRSSNDALGPEERCR